MIAEVKDQYLDKGTSLTKQDAQSILLNAFIDHQDALIDARDKVVMEMRNQSFAFREEQ
ncbi:hypothetical protein QCN27_06500 [Cereibacter sp. SYSU M97828]|nr:hypothetical protein [Cereibacter flavus]